MIALKLIALYVGVVGLAVGLRCCEPQPDPACILPPPCSELRAWAAQCLLPGECANVACTAPDTLARVCR